MPVLIGVSYIYNTLSAKEKYVHTLVESGLEIVALYFKNGTLSETTFIDGVPVNYLMVQNMLKKGALTIKKRITYDEFSKVFSDEGSKHYYAWAERNKDY